MSAVVLSGGHVLGSGGSVFSVNTGQAWTFSDLITGFNPGTYGSATWGFQDDGSTGNGASSGWQVGGYMKLNYAASGTFGLRFGTSQTGLHEICVQYDILRSFNACSKQCKTYGWGLINTSGSPPYSNATFGCTMGGYTGTGYGVYYGDAASGSNDNACPIACSGYPTGSLPAIGFGGSFSRTPYPTQGPTIALTQDITGTVWQTIMVYYRASSAGTNDGQITIWSYAGGVWTMQLNLTAMWNCSSTTQDRGGFGLGEYSANSGFYEYYRNCYQMFAKPVGMGI